jgi:hypothetical protein
MIALALELGGYLVSDGYKDIMQSKSNDVREVASRVAVGITFHLAKTSFKSIKPADSLP